MANRAYDRAAIKFRGVDADINFNLSDYEEDMIQVGMLLIILFLGWICITLLNNLQIGKFLLRV